MKPYDLSQPIRVRRMRARWPGDPFWHRVVLWRILRGRRPFWRLQRWVYVEEITDEWAASVPQIDFPLMTCELTRPLVRRRDRRQDRREAIEDE